MNPVSIGIPIPAPQGREAAYRPALMVRPWLFMVSAYQRHRQRRALARLDGRLLRDIGITPAQAEAEVGKPFWRA